MTLDKFFYRPCGRIYKIGCLSWAKAYILIMSGLW